MSPFQSWAARQVRGHTDGQQLKEEGAGPQKEGRSLTRFSGHVRLGDHAAVRAAV